MNNNKITTATCAECGGACCTYVAMEIDKPSCKKDYDHVRWYLLHRDVSVFIDHDKNWFVEFETPCECLGEEGMCAIYEKRPRICRGHGAEEGTCEFFNDPYQKKFTHHKEFEEYLDKKGIKWKWKKG